MLHRSCSWPGGQQRRPVPWDDQTSLSQTPICCPPPLLSTLPMDDPATRRGQLCRRGAAPPPQGPEPQRKSPAVHRGNPAPLGVPAQPGTIRSSVLGLWRRSSAAKVGSHWPAAPTRPSGPVLTLGLIHHHWRLDYSRRDLVLINYKCICLCMYVWVGGWVGSLRGAVHTSNNSLFSGIFLVWVSNQQFL